MHTLYEIADWIEAIIHNGDGEISDQASDRLDALTIKLEQKLENVVKAIRCYGESEGAKRAEAARLLDSARRDEARAAWLREYVICCLSKIGETKAFAGIFRLAVVRNSSPTVTFDGDPIELPVHLRTAKWSADKTAIAALAKEHGEAALPPGVRITVGQHLRIS